MFRSEQITYYVTTSQTWFQNRPQIFASGTGSAFSEVRKGSESCFFSLSKRIPYLDTIYGYIWIYPYVDFSKFSRYPPLPNKTKLKFDQDFKACCKDERVKVFALRWLVGKFYQIHLFYFYLEQFCTLQRGLICSL